MVLFAFIRTALVSASQRYLSYDIGKGDEEQIRKTFSMSINTDVCLAIFIVVLSETIGLWFVNNKLEIPMERMTAANVVYQFSILTFLVDILKIPYNSAIIAYEKMSFYAYVSILEAVLKLVVVYFLVIANIDKLCLYGFLLAFVSVIIFLSYYVYCRRLFLTCRYEKYWDKRYFSELIRFSGWSMLSAIANVSAQQGGNILLNIFVGLTANAAYGIATQVSHAIYAFASNFHTAFAPQITKLYAVADKENLYRLIFRSSLASFYLILVLAVPFIFRMNFVLGLWLKEVPLYSTGFCILMILYQVIDAYQSPLTSLVYSTGRIKEYTIWLSFLIFLNLPLSYILLKMGMCVYIVLTIRLLINLLTAVIRIMFIRKLMDFPIKDYICKVILRSVIPTILIVGLSYMLVITCGESLLSGFLYFLSCIILSATVVVAVGFSKSDRSVILSIVRNKMSILNK